MRARGAWQGNVANAGMPGRVAGAVDHANRARNTATGLFRPKVVAVTQAFHASEARNGRPWSVLDLLALAGCKNEVKGALALDAMGKSRVQIMRK